MSLVPLRGFRLAGPRLSTHKRSPSIFSRVSQPKAIVGHGLSSRHRMKSTLAHNDSSAPKSGLASESVRQKATVAYIAFGSNVGNRLHMIENAIKSLDAENDITVLRTSGVWETKAMYVVDQDNFLNGVCEVKTTLKPLDLLDKLQAIEIFLGRRKTIDKGPRSIDLDILLYGNETTNHERLGIPHKLMLERTFVLNPLCELIPNSKPPGNQGSQTFAGHLKVLKQYEKSPMSTITPLSELVPPLKALIPSRKTHIMSVVNVTPDSFSDGGVHNMSDLEKSRATFEDHLKGGATMIDIGGQSTRPNAEAITADEELSRVVTAIHIASRTISELGMEGQAVISIDTYRAAVAEAAIEAGAHVVNDVSAGTLDEDMLPTVARLGCPLVLMHMRGNPLTMANSDNTSYPKGLIETIGAELFERIRAAEKAGIRRWRIILDPGIGFAKNRDQNLEILRRFAELRQLPGLHGFPWVVGASRKGFIGKITGVEEASERTWGTAAAVTAAIQGGADIVRVHDVDEMVKVVKMADAVWRV